MPKITIKPRNGKDFFNFNQRVLVNTKLAQDWAIEEFVLVDEKPITTEQITKLSTESYIKLNSSIFSLNVTPASETMSNIEVMGYTIDKKRLSRDFISELQAVTKSANGNSLKIMKFCLTEFYDVEISELEAMPYQVVGVLLSKVNFFLSSVTEPTDEFYIDDLLNTDTESVTR